MRIRHKRDSKASCIPAGEAESPKRRRKDSRAKIPNTLALFDTKERAGFLEGSTSLNQTAEVAPRTYVRKIHVSNRQPTIDHPLKHQVQATSLSRKNNSPMTSMDQGRQSSGPSEPKRDDHQPERQSSRPVNRIAVYEIKFLPDSSQVRVEQIEGTFNASLHRHLVFNEIDKDVAAALTAPRNLQVASNLDLSSDASYIERRQRRACSVVDSIDFQVSWDIYRNAKRDGYGVRRTQNHRQRNK